MSTLLRCPFCGGEAEIERKGSARVSMIIVCQDCGCRVESGDVYGLTQPESWHWNRRVKHAADEALQLPVSYTEYLNLPIAQKMALFEKFSPTSTSNTATHKESAP